MSSTRNKIQRNLPPLQPLNTLNMMDNSSHVGYSEQSKKFDPDNKNKKGDRTKKTLDSRTLSQKWSMLQTQHLHNKLLSSKENVFQNSFKSQSDETWGDGLQSQEFEQSYPSYALLEDSDDELEKINNASQHPTKYLDRNPSLSFSSEEDLKQELKNQQTTKALFHHNSTINSVFQSYQSVSFNQIKNQRTHTQSIANIQYGSQQNIFTTTDMKGAFPQSPAENLKKYCNEDSYYQDDFCDSTEYLQRKLVDDDGDEDSLKMNKGSPYDFSPLDDSQDPDTHDEKKGSSKSFHNNTIFNTVSKHHPSTEILLSRERRFSFMSDMSQSDATDAHSPLNEESVHSLDGQSYTPDGSSLSSPSCWSRNYNNYNQNAYFPSKDHNLNSSREKDMDDKEKLLVGLIQRLQDDPSIILHVDAMNVEYDSFVKELSYHIEESNPFVKTPEDKDGIITGYPRVIREKLINKYGSILNDIQNEAKQSDSITEFSLSIDGHNKELCKALHFVSVIVNAAKKEEENGSMVSTLVAEEKENDNSCPGQQAPIPFHSLISASTISRSMSMDISEYDGAGLFANNNGKRTKWKAKKWLKAALRIDCHGDGSPLDWELSSQFSDPSNSTYAEKSNGNSHALGSTKHSSVFSRSSAKSYWRKNDFALRRTIELLGTILQKISIVNEKILCEIDENNENSSLSRNTTDITEELLRNYSQIMSISKPSICALHNAFYPERISPVSSIKDCKKLQDLEEEAICEESKRTLALSNDNIKDECLEGNASCEPSKLSSEMDAFHCEARNRNKDDSENTEKHDIIATPPSVILKSNSQCDNEPMLKTEEPTIPPTQCNEGIPFVITWTESNDETSILRKKGQQRNELSQITC